MTEQSPHPDPLERIVAVLERQEKAFERHEVSIERLFRRMEARDARSEERERHAQERERRAEERHQSWTDRWERSEKLFVAAMSEINADLQRLGERLDDMGDAIRANTEAVLSVLDRLNPGTT